jgi:hypothetical protein
MQSGKGNLAGTAPSVAKAGAGVEEFQQRSDGWGHVRGSRPVRSSYPLAARDTISIVANSRDDGGGYEPVDSSRCG